MRATARHRIMTLVDFLAWEARQEVKFEFDGFEPVAMAGGSARHARLQRNLAISVGSRLRGGRCEFFGSDMKLVTGMQSRSPDGQVVCGPVAAEATFSTTPTVVFEVVSPSSAATDRGEKAEEYCRIASVRSYVMLEQDRVAAVVVRPAGDERTTESLGAGDVLRLPEISVEVALAELYEGVLG